MSTESEQQAYAAMQARLIALLLRHDDRGFRRFYDARTDFDPEEETDDLRRYRELGVIFHLRDELFEHILPRIVRRLSFESPRSLVVEEPPAQGRVDWERTLDATWAERPGETPLLLHTRQRRRDFATPGNLLTVVTLLEFRADVQRLLWDEREAVGASALRHPLNEIAERCDRELQFPQFAGLRHVAQHIIDGADGGPDALEMRVGEQVLPGANSAYQELLEWRVRRRTLHLLRRTESTQPDDVLGADPRRDNYLYQLWIFYELADLLLEHERLIALDSRNGKMCLRFRWGEVGAECQYELRHDQAVPNQVGHWTVIEHGLVGSVKVPGVRPDFYLRRVHPPLERHAKDNVTYWREPGVVWDAKYYRERESPRVPSSPIKRMIADLELLGEEDGTLLFAFLKQPQVEGVAITGDVEEQTDDEDEQDERHEPVRSTGILTLPRSFAAVGSIAPEEGHDHMSTPARKVSVAQLRPESEAVHQVRATLTERLNVAHARMRHVREPQCHGIFLDTLSAASHGPFRDRYGRPVSHDPAELLLCPKPHVGPWRVDLVSRQEHCCQDGRICQIIGRPDRKKPVRPPRTAQELMKELAQMLEGTQAPSGEDTLDAVILDAEATARLAREIEQLARRFADLAGIYPRIEVYYNRLRDLGMQHTLDLLSPQERESLAIGIFLVEQLDSIGAHDYSAPGTHISSVVELAVQKRVFSCPGLVGMLADPKRQTLGVLPYILRNPWESEGNWERICAYVEKHWQGAVDPDYPEHVITFEDFVGKTFGKISFLRNTAAHKDQLSRKSYADLQRITLQGGPLGIGALNVLLLAWHE